MDKIPATAIINIRYTYQNTLGAYYTKTERKKKSHKKEY